MKTASLVVRWFPVLAYCALIIFFSSISNVPGTPPHADKVVHAFEYAIFAALLWFALAGKKPVFPVRSRMLVIIFAGSVFAVLDEYYQSFIPGRLATPGDWMADVAGICGFITFSVIRFKWMERAPAYETP